MRSVFLIFFLFSFSAFSQTVETLISCNNLQTNMSHQILKVDGELKGSIRFPIYDVPYTPEKLFEKQLEFVNWDAQSPPPKDERMLGVSVPLFSSSQFVSDKERILERIEFFNSIFKKLERTDYVTLEFGTLALNFRQSTCDMTKEGDFNSINCTDLNVGSLNGVPIRRVMFHMSNQKIEQFEIDADGVLKLKKINQVYTSLEFISNNKRFISDYTYFPNEEQVACSIDGKNLPKFSN